jgi:sporulation protein YlmC with PRC-barrel domain
MQNDVNTRTSSRDFDNTASDAVNSRDDSHRFRRVMSAGTLAGDRVRNSQGDDLGTIEEIMLDVTTGRVAYAVLSFGGFLGIGDKLFAIPWEALELNEAEHEFLLDVDRQQLESAPGFDKNNWPDMADPSWGAMIHSHYGRTPYWEQSGSGRTQAAGAGPVGSMGSTGGSSDEWLGTTGSSKVSGSNMGSGSGSTGTGEGWRQSDNLRREYGSESSREASIDRPRTYSAGSTSTGQDTGNARMTPVTADEFPEAVESTRSGGGTGSEFDNPNWPNEEDNLTAEERARRGRQTTTSQGRNTYNG